MLTVRNLAVAGIAPFDLDIDSGECVALTGPSGSGKTLVLRALADLDPNEGEVSLDGAPRMAVGAPDWRRRVAYLSAEPGWWEERVAPHFPDGEATMALLAFLGLPPDLLDQSVATVSTGERHRLALVRILLLEPRVLLLDEPTSGLDDIAAGRVEAILAERLSGDVSILLVTHDLQLAERLAHRRLRIRDGALGRDAEFDSS
ncbi:MAG: ATP-binding cassette domain-containing protein [Alphaproteobacteria bacterium]